MALHSRQRHGLLLAPSPAKHRAKRCAFNREIDVKET
jgi:hypothetical protein